MRKQLEEIISKNGELSRANGELRHKITELEFQMKDQKEKLAKEKHHVDHLTKVRHKQDENIRVLEVSFDKLIWIKIVQISKTKSNVNSKL